MHDDNSCPNCGKLIDGKENYCPACGQKFPAHRLTIKHLAHELFHSVTHADKGILLLLKSLATKPGIVAKEYVEGKRKKYFNPFTFLLLCTAVVVFLNSQFNYLPEVKADPAILKQIPNEKARAKYLLILHRSQEVIELVSKKPNLIYIIAIPFYAFIMWLFFRKRNFAEHLVANVYFCGFLALTASFFSVLLSLLNHSGNSSSYMIFLFPLYIIYQTVAYHKFLNYSSTKGLPRVIVATITLNILWFLFSFVCMIFYIYGSNTLYVIKKLASVYIK